jgi:organic radical activating enzyme
VEFAHLHRILFYTLNYEIKMPTISSTTSSKSVSKRTRQLKSELESVSTAPEKPLTASSTSSLPVMEAFYTLQGEGVFMGHAAYFIRLGGCDVGCFWCDVKDSWDKEAHPQQSISQIVKEASSFPARLVVITGGEPLMHDLDELTDELKKEGFRIHIETSGAHPLSGTLDWITLSPKRFKKPLSAIYQKAHELKMVMYALSDLEWAQEEARKVSDSCKLLIQPEWSKSSKNLPILIEFVKENPRWQVSLQTHKFMDIP